MADCGPGWFSCCDVEAICTPFSDAFGRAASTDLGADWEEIGGNHWDIYSNTLRNFDGTGIALEVPTAEPVYGFYASFSTVAEGTENNWRIVLNYDPATGYYHYVNFARGNVDNVTLSVGYHGAGGDVVIDADSTADINNAPIPPCTQVGYPTAVDHNTTRTITACLSARGIFGIATMPVGPATYYYAWGPAGGPINSTHSRAGLASLNGQSTRFDDFHLFRDTTDLTICQDCPCHCGDGYVANTYPAKTLTLTIINTTGICTNLEGLSFTLYRDRSCIWRGLVEWYTYGPACAQLTLGDGTAGLSIPSPYRACYGTGAGTGTCNPVNMVFPGFRGNIASPPTCGCETPGRGGSFDWQLTE